MSSVCASVLMFGVSGVIFHGIGLRHIGIPSMIAAAVAAAGREEDDVVLRVQVRILRDVLRADVRRTGSPVEVERLAPPAFGLRARATCA